jgi:hypothetical protein
MAFFQSLGIVPLFIVMSSNRASYRIMASPPILSISPGMQSAPTNLLFPIIANRFLRILILMVKGLSVLVLLICGMSRSLLKTEA